MESITNILSLCSELSISTVLLLIIACMLLHGIFLSGSRYSHPLPPVPCVGLPIIGHLHKMDYDMREPLRKFRKQCGDVYRLQLGQKLVVILSGYEAIKDAFLKNADEFAHRPSMHVFDLFTHKLGIINSNGEVWKEHRRFALSTLKDFGMGKSKLERSVLDEVEEFLKEVDETKHTSFDPKDIISTHIANIICSILFRKTFRTNDTRFREMINMFDKNLKSVNNLASFIPWMAHIPGDPLKLKNIIHKSNIFFDYLKQIIAEHLESFDENNIDDLTSAYIKYVKEHEKSGEPTTFNYDQLSGVISDLFMAGSKTTTTALRWSIACLIIYPETQERMFAEISKHVGNDRLHFIQDRVALTYVEAFYMEVLRYCNIFITSGFHGTLHDVVFRGYSIPKEAVIYPDLDSVFTNTQIWNDPENFRPERFLDDTRNLKKHEEFIVFFLGKRSCIGESLTRMEIFLFLSALVQRFQLHSPPEKALTWKDVDGEFGIVHGPKRFKIVAQRRL